MRKAHVREDSWLMGLRDASEQSGIAQSRLFTMVHAGDVKSLRFGKRIMVDMDDLRRWKDEQTQRSIAI